MQGYIHHHTTFDEVIPEHKQHLNQNITSPFNSRNKKKKPVWMEEKYPSK